jgi:hypothetical protein
VKTMKHKFTIDIWRVVDIGEINEALDEDMTKKKKKHIATDIYYRCLKVNKDGRLTLEANYTPEEY